MKIGDENLFGVAAQVIPAACGGVAGCGNVQIVVDVKNSYEDFAIPAGSLVWLVWTEEGWQVASAEVK